MVDKRRPNIVFYPSPVLGEVKVGPWLVEWCVVRDYGSVSVVAVHVYYRLAERIQSVEGPRGMGDTVLLIVPDRPDRLHRLVEYDDLFLVVVDEEKGVVLSANESTLVSWIYVLGAEERRVEAEIAGERRVNASLPLLVPGYFSLAAGTNTSGFMAKFYNNTYIVFSPRGFISGPYSVFVAYWGVRLGELGEAVEEGLVDRTVAEIVNSSLRFVTAEKGLMARIFLPFLKVVYDAPSGAALLYDTYVEPMVAASSGFNTTRVFLDSRSFSYADAVVMSKEVRSASRELEASIPVQSISQGVMFLYNSSLLDPGSRARVSLPLPPAIKSLVDFALSKSLFARGCSPRALEGLNASFLGGWSWSLVEEKYSAKTKATGTASSVSTAATPTTTTTLVQGGDGFAWSVAAAVLALIGLGVGVGLAVYEKRVSRRAG